MIDLSKAPTSLSHEQAMPNFVNELYEEVQYTDPIFTGFRSISNRMLVRSEYPMHESLSRLSYAVGLRVGVLTVYHSLEPVDQLTYWEQICRKSVFDFIKNYKENNTAAKSLVEAAASTTPLDVIDRHPEIGVIADWLQGQIPKGTSPAAGEAACRGFFSGIDLCDRVWDAASDINLNAMFEQPVHIRAGELGSPTPPIVDGPPPTT